VLFNLPTFRPYARMSALFAFVSLLAGGLFIFVDIGRPERMWQMLRLDHLGSPMLWDVALTVVYLLVSTIYLWSLMAPGKMEKVLKPMALLALLAGLADGLTGFVFATQVAREFWFSAVQPVSFFVAALASAGAAILLFLLVMRPSGHVTLDCCDLNPLAGLTAVALGIDLMLIASEIITLAFTRSPDALELVQFMVTSPLFWIEIVAALIAITLLLLPATRSIPGWVSLAAVLALVDLALKRFLFVRLGFVAPNIKYPGAIAPVTSYAPSLVEWGVVIGLVGLFALLLTVGFRSLRLSAAQKA
jgi:molybdopterin-containing oxidoreductase family membrane subunit